MLLDKIRSLVKKKENDEDTEVLASLHKQLSVQKTLIKACDSKDAAVLQIKGKVTGIVQLRPRLHGSLNMAELRAQDAPPKQLPSSEDSPAMHLPDQLQPAQEAPPKQLPISHDASVMHLPDDP